MESPRKTMVSPFFKGVGLSAAAAAASTVRARQARGMARRKRGMGSSLLLELVEGWLAGMVWLAPGESNPVVGAVVALGLAAVYDKNDIAFLPKSNRRIPMWRKLFAAATV